MAMYYYASKLNEASCSGCHMKVPPPPAEAAPLPPPPSDHAPLPPSSALLQGSGLSYYDNDDYYSMVRGNKFMSDNSCKHIVMNGAINFVAAQSKNEGQSLPTVLGTGVKSLANLPYADCMPEKSDIEYKDGHIISASLETLVDMLRPGASRSFTFTLLLCSRLFIKPHELLGKLCKRYFKNYEKIGKTEGRELVDRELSDMVALVRILAQWTTCFPYDFRDDRVMALVRNITQRCAAEHMSSVRGEVSSMLERLLARLTALEHYEGTLIQTPPVSHVDQLTQGDILTMGLVPVELANQLTAVELHRLSFVGPEELVQTFAPAQPQPANGSRQLALHHVDAKTTRNLEAYADWFNHLSYLVATDILKAMKSKYRARVLEQWVMTARECFNLGNFNSLMAIISALNMTPIARLKKTNAVSEISTRSANRDPFELCGVPMKAGPRISNGCEKHQLAERLDYIGNGMGYCTSQQWRLWSRTSPVCGQQLRQLELCVEPSGNHARYRAALAAAPTETAVPLLSVTCRDLHFANQGNPSRLPGNRVNFEKCSLLARHVSTQLASRRLVSEEGVAPPPAPPPHPPVWRFLNDQPTLTETGLELASFEREPPVDHMEKERLKRLRGAL